MGSIFDDIRDTKSIDLETDPKFLPTDPIRFGEFRNQKFLPPQLRADQTGAFINKGIAGIADLLKDPGGVSPSLFEAIQGRQQQESQQISQNFENIREQQTGQAARTNQPVSLKNALGQALDTAQARAERSSKQQAVGESEVLRRQDLGQTYNLLDSILQFISSGRGQRIQGLQGAGLLDFGSQQLSDQRNAGRIAALGSILGSVGSGGKKNDSTGQEVLDPFNAGVL